MAILIANDGHRDVDTIAERDAIVKRFNGMTVFVRDSIADPTFGGGAVQYLWDSVVNSWSPVWSEKKPTLNFTTEDKVLVNGQVTADQTIKDNVVWSARIIDDDDTILADARVSITGLVLNIGTNQFDGKRLHYTYAYGEYAPGVEDLINSKADKESPEFTGTPLTPTPNINEPTPQQIVNVEYFNNSLQAALENVAGLDSPIFDGTPTTPTPTEEASFDQITNVGYVNATIETAIENLPTPGSFNTYSLLTSTSASGNLVIDPSVQQVWAINSSAGTRNVSLVNGPSGRAITAVLVFLGKNAPTMTGTNFKWSGNTTPVNADMGDTKTVVTAFWDGIDTWLLTVGPKY